MFIEEEIGVVFELLFGKSSAASHKKKEFSSFKFPRRKFSCYVWTLFGGKHTRERL